MVEGQSENVQLSVGSMLVSARQRAGMSVADMADKLKLGMRQVESLEAGRYHDLPGELFVRGFVRNYARLVGADEQLLLQTLNYELKPQAAPAIVAESENIALRSKKLPRWVIGLGVLALLVLLVPTLVYYGLNRDMGLPLPKGIMSHPEAGQKTVSLSPQVHGFATATAPAASQMHAASSVASSAVVNTATGPIRLSFSGDSWVEVYDGMASRVFYQMGHASEVAYVNGAPPFNLVVGNASAVSITFHGQPVDLAPFTKVSVARLKLQ